jgi:alginate O-acetyltransferase complex protein AlgI
MGLIARGFFKKLVLADRIALAVDPFFAHVGDVTTEGVWSLPYVYLYALQIYLDFSAYTDIARGLGLLFGYRWPENFARPYLAVSVQDFWRRWHMTLSRFLRDYLYISLGGDRHGRLRTAVNIMVTMLLGGMWHGASWSFLLWGALHGAYLIVHRAWSCSIPGRRLAGDPGLVGRLWHACAIILTFHAVCFAWCFFRLTQLTDSLACVQKLLVFDAGSMLVGGACDSSLWLLLVAYGLLLVVREGSLRWIAGSVPSRRPILGSFVRGVQWGSISTLFALAFVLSQGGGSRPFIYFQF